MPRFTFPWKKFSFTTDPQAPKKSEKEEQARVSSTEKAAIMRRSSAVVDDALQQRHRSSNHSAAAPEPENMFTRAQSCEGPAHVSPPSARDSKPVSQRPHGETFPAAQRKEFDVKRSLGEGSFGQVLLANWTSSSTTAARPKQVALKVLKTEEMFDGQLEEAGVEYEDIVAAFEQEIALMELVGRHPNIVQVYAKGTDGRSMAMQCARSDIYHIVKKMGAALPLSLCEQWSRHLLCGIDFIHTQGVIHQDIKSSNILIQSDGTAKICDFGLAVKGRARMVVDRELLTLWYRAPELLMGARVYTQNVDEWGAGAIMLEMLLGRVAFPGSAASQCACTCNRVSHANFNRDQLAKVFKVLGTPPDNVTQELACYKHFQAWPRYKPALKELIAEAIAGRTSSSSSASASAGTTRRRSSLSDYLPPSPGAPFRSNEVDQMHQHVSQQQQQQQLASHHNKIHDVSSVIPVPSGLEEGLRAMGNKASGPAVTAAWTDAISQLLTCQPELRAAAADILARARLFSPPSASSSTPDRRVSSDRAASSESASSEQRRATIERAKSHPSPEHASSTSPKDTTTTSTTTSASASASSSNHHHHPHPHPPPPHAASASSSASNSNSIERAHSAPPPPPPPAPSLLPNDDTWKGRHSNGGIRVGVGHEHSAQHPTLEIGH